MARRKLQRRLLGLGDGDRLVEERAYERLGQELSGQVLAVGRRIERSLAQLVWIEVDRVEAPLAFVGLALRVAEAQLDAVAMGDRCSRRGGRERFRGRLGA